MPKSSTTVSRRGTAAGDLAGHVGIFRKESGIFSKASSNSRSRRRRGRMTPQTGRETAVPFSSSPSSSENGSSHHVRGALSSESTSARSSPVDVVKLRVGKTPIREWTSFRWVFLPFQVGKKPLFQNGQA